MLNETTKILPVDEFDIKGIQSWLEEMAQQGFYLDDTIGTWWHFNGGEAKAVRYRIDPCGKNTGKINPEKKQVFEDMGWHYVVTYRDYQIFMTDDPDVEELHTDRRVEGIALKKLERRLWVDIIQMLVIVALPYLISSFQREELVNAIRYPVLFWTGENVAIIFVYIFAFIYLVKIGVSLKRMRTLRRTLSEGMDCETYRHAFKTRRMYKIWNFFFASLMCLLGFTLLSSCNSVQDLDLPDTPTDILSLENLEPGKVITDREDYPKHLGGWVDRRRNPLLEDNYQIYQNGLVNGREENSQPAYVTLEAEYYKLRIPDMAKTLYEEMKEKNIKNAAYTYDTTSVEGTELDACVVLSAKQKQILVGLVGNEVIYVEYDGGESLAENAAKIEGLMLETPLVRP